MRVVTVPVVSLGLVEDSVSGGVPVEVDVSFESPVQASAKRENQWTAID